MKVTRVETLALSYPLEKPIWDAQLFIPNRNAVLVKVHTDEGITGVGESASFGGGGATTRAIIENQLAPFVVGQDPLMVEQIWQRMYQGTVHLGRRGAVIAALSGIDIALWDIVGKAAGRPLYQVLGGFCHRVRAYASAGFYQEGKDATGLAAEMAAYVAEGFTAVKIKVAGLPLKKDVDRVAAVRQAIGDGIELMVDANNSYEPKTAIRFAQAIEDYDIAWFEEPVKTDNIDGSAQVASSITIPVSGYETESTRYGFRELITRGAVDIVQPDAIWSGGISEVRKIAALASAFGLPCIPHSFSTAITLVANLHVIASIPNGRMVEVDRNPNPLREELLTRPLRLDADGYLPLPSGPGLGVELNEETVERYRV